jgi:phospholipid transport system transporter-binding protein
MLKLPESVRLHEVSALWNTLEGGLRAEAGQIGDAAGRQVRLDASTLQRFDSAMLALLLAAARLCGRQGLSLQVDNAPPTLRELARVYGVEELLWPAQAAGA